MKIRSAEFILSASSPWQFPAPTLPEIAFAGRSNVGKSTLINSLLNRKKLVKTSSTPGKTQLINFFKINDAFHFVDLPGYGFAKVPENVRQQWQRLIEAYLQERECLRNVVLIVDSRHGPTAQDRQLKEWLDYYERPVLIVASKIDKLKRGQIQKHLKQIRQDLSLEKTPLAHSSLEKGRREDIWKNLVPSIEAEI
ncbi:MAG TPA: YihA family ribosome biogenesis GTP-binding protein [Candidatus Lambdaproteobacteria bacterium]|jgi:GTP-binding protein|nr:ribosome biogenesis GTP-binding protein YihA/YsxC [SAR324 cluster bacterium]HBL56046.1 YihA family ribosome biogenesis GTP-binding protein [Deltaproteobacteria bacterium]HHZ78463.1 YihA family ribosome biogenesis GTP-binding protein [Candidatus Lambdaproteobacteria bacterium]HIA57226.1 YihA family ribosome biogenesis GTP-binding protein [Candidatus Lambdaproteobacteria bacterium]HIB44639.1 YihA family ribosome biogenesis GTP-binding protein [Candidatus Lambdaproteobacteria bacterium]